MGIVCTDIMTFIAHHLLKTHPNIGLNIFQKGDCPKCGAVEQYGDNCEVCGATYSSTELNNAKSAISGENNA
jgi:hypothetical protein